VTAVTDHEDEKGDEMDGWVEGDLSEGVVSSDTGYPTPMGSEKDEERRTVVWYE
jgi:hypothetical protein